MPDNGVLHITLTSRLRRVGEGGQVHEPFSGGFPDRLSLQPRHADNCKDIRQHLSLLLVDALPYLVRREGETIVRLQADHRPGVHE